MRYDRVEFHNDTDGKSRITLYFSDTEPSMPQMDNMVVRTVEMSYQEWAKFVLDVEKISGIKEMIAALEGKQDTQMCRCVYPDKCFCPESAKT